MNTADAILDKADPVNLPSKNRYRAASIGALAAVLVGLLLLGSRFGNGLQQLSYELPFLLRPQVSLTNVVIIYMDWDSHVRLGQDQFQRWDRTLHARLLDRLREMGARSVVFDVVFLPTTNNAAADRELVCAARALGKVVVGALVTPDVQAGELAGWHLTKPFAELEAVTTSGVVEVGDENKSVRQHYYRRDFELPSLAWRAVEQTLAPTNLPDPFVDRWMNYYGPPGTFSHYSFWEVLATNRLSAAEFSNKAVFVGALYDIGMTGGKGTDDFRTPYTRWTGTRSPGAEINATAYVNLLRRDWLSRLPPIAEAIVITLAGIVAAFGLYLCSPRWAVALGLLAFAIVAATAIYLQCAKLIWFPWLIIAAVQIPCALVCSLIGRLERVPVTQPDAGRRLSIPDHQLIRCIGRGAYGEVWLARNAIGTYHAVKLVERKRFSDQAPFEREFNGLTRFMPLSRDHPGLIDILHVGRNDVEGLMYYVMEAGDPMDGQDIDVARYSPRTLAAELKQRQRLPLVECVQLGLDLSGALDFMHQHHLIHRDIKPSNIIFVKGSAKLADIGLVTDVACEVGDVSYLGTKGYIPPEGPGTAAGDVYSLGKVLYEASTGLQVSAFPDLPSDLVARSKDPFYLLNAILLQACENTLELRYPSAAALHAALLDLKQKLSGHALHHEH